MANQLVLKSSPLHAILEGLEGKPGVKYEDPEFPASAASIGDVKFVDGEKHEIVWLRPKEFKNADDPRVGKLFVDGLEPDDVEQGLLADDYFCASLMVLAECNVRIHALFDRHVENDHGVYCVTMFFDGEHRHVVVDDRIPCDATTKMPIFSRCRRGGIWLPIIEKAYAKLRGSYAAIQKGEPSAALSDLLGCPVFMRPCTSLSDEENHVLLDIIKRHDRLDHVMCCRASPEVPKDSGLVPERWYGLLEVREYKGETLMHVRYTISRQPGLGDWAGRWSNKDEEKWTKETSDNLYHTREMDGTFWMTFQDWTTHFDTMIIADVESDWDFVSCSFPLKSGTNIVAVMESRHDIMVSLTMRQACAMDNCVPLRMCLVTAERPYVPLGGTSMSFISRQALSTPMIHVVPGKYLVLVQVPDDKKEIAHRGVVTSYSASMSITFTPASEDDEELKRPRQEVGFILPGAFENRVPNCCALCNAPVAPDRTVELCGIRVHPWCQLCYTCGEELNATNVTTMRLPGAAETRLICKRCSGYKDMRSQKGEEIRGETQKIRSKLASECSSRHLRKIPKAEPTPILDPVTKARALDVLALSKERMKKSSFLRSQISDADVRAVFQVTDHNGNGSIDRGELALLLQSSGMCLSSIPAIQKFQVKTVMDEADKGAGSLSLKRFCKWYQHADWQAMEENMQRLERIAAVFLSCDKNGNTTLEREELEELHNKLVDLGITDVSFQDLFDLLDKNNTKRIELNEFVTWFQEQAPSSWF